MQDVVNGRLPLGDSQVAGEWLARLRPLPGEGHVAERRHAAGDGSTGTAVKVVDPGRGARHRRRHLREVDVHVGAAGKDESTGGVDLLLPAQRAAQMDDLAVK